MVNEVFSERLVDKNGSTGINSDVINVEGDRAFVLRVAQYKAESIEPFETVNADIEALVKRQKASAQLKADGEKLLAALQAGKGDEALKAADTQFGAVQTVSFLAPATDITGVAMKMTPPSEGKPTYAIAYDQKDNLLIVQLDKVTLGQPTADELNQLANEYRGAMSSAVNEALMLNLRTNAKIEVQSLE